MPAEISESPPPITPASALPRSRSAMSRSSGSSARSLPSRVTIFSPGRAVRTTISRPGDLVEIEGVQRMAELEQHEVRGVDHVGDRADAARLEPAREPGRRGADLHALDDARRVPRRTCPAPRCGPSPPRRRARPASGARARGAGRCVPRIAATSRAIPSARARRAGSG